MGEVLTVKEIEARFPSEWVLLADPQINEYQEVLSGRLICHSKNRDEVYDEAIALPPPKNIAVLYTGAVPAPGKAIIL